MTVCLKLEDAVYSGFNRSPASGGLKHHTKSMAGEDHIAAGTRITPPKVYSMAICIPFGDGMVLRACINLRNHPRHAEILGAIWTRSIV